MRQLILGLILLSSISTNASVLFEPYAGYSVGQVKKIYSPTFATASLQGTSDSGAINGLAYGGRVGFLARHFAILAAEYQGVTGKEKMDKQTTSSNWSQSTIFGVMGFQNSLGFRLLAGYGFTSKFTEAGTPETKYSGTALKGTLGWITPADFAINVDYTYYQLADMVQSGVSSKVKDSYTKFDYSAVMVTLSLPFTFLGGGGGGGHSHEH